MQAVILLGGQGTRLRALYPDQPKALVPVAGKPFIEWQIDWLRRGGITAIHLAAGHQADQIEGWASTRPGITVSCEPEPLGTGGALKFVESHIQSDPFLVVNGDTLLPSLPFQALKTHHQTASHVWMTLVVTRIEEAGRFGTVEFDEDGRVTAFKEKAQHDAGWINGGVYLVNKALFDCIPAHQTFSLERELFPAWIREGRVQSITCPPPLLDMGTPEGLEEMAQFLS